jgi:hypothetical protein
MLVAMHQPHYLPWMGLLDKLSRADLFVFVDHVQFERKEWQNRNWIKSPAGPLLLTVPVKQVSRSEPICEKRIDKSKPWRRKHMKAMSAAYIRAPYFDSHRYVLDCIERSGDRLADLAIELTLTLAKALGINTPTVRSSQLKPVLGKKTDLVVDLCKDLGASTFLSGDGAATYLDVAAFERAGIELRWQRFRHAQYLQQFPELGFVPRLAAVDLLFNEGPNAYWAHSWSINDAIRS